MGTALVTLPDGKKAKITFESQEQLDSAVTDLTAAHGEFEASPYKRLNPTKKLEEAVGEPALAMGSGMLASAVGGVGGLARGAGAGIASLAQGEGLARARDAFTDEAVDTLGRVQEKMTYQPKTALGKKATSVATFPFELLAKAGDAVGGKVADVTGSPAAGAGANTLTQSLPAALLGGAKAMKGRMTPKPELTLEEGIKRPSPPPEPADSPVPRETPPPKPQADAAKPADPLEARAQEYARSIGLDWSRVGAGTKKALTTIAQDAGALERLNPAAVRRQAHLQSLRVPVQATRGQLERDPVQLRREAIASNTTEGQPIRDMDIAANRDLQANLEALRGRAGGRRGTLEEPVNEEGVTNPASIRGATKTPTEVGESVQGVARDKAKWSKKGYDALFKKAETTEPDALAPLKPVTDLLANNPDIQHIGWVKTWLNNAREAKARKNGTPVGETPLDDVTLAELNDLRKTASDNAKPGAPDAFHAGKVRQAVLEAMDTVPEGAKAWKAANDAFRTHAKEFKDQSIVAKLVNQKRGGADRALALEKTWKTISSAPVEQIKQIKKTLLKGANPALRVKGAKAWLDLRAETVNRLLEDARNVTAADETERAILTEVALRRSINRIPRENLEEILGKGNVRELNDILRARRITTRSPVGGRTTQSGTVPNALVMMEKVLKHIPGVKYAVGAKHAIGELGERGTAAKAVKEATVSPLEQAVRDVERASKKRASRAAIEVLEGSGPTLSTGASPMPIGEALKRPTL